jgi:hypothetical protein
VFVVVAEGVCEGVPGGVPDGVGDFDIVAVMEGVCVGVCVGEGVSVGLGDEDWLALGYNTLEIMRTAKFPRSDTYRLPYAVSNKGKHGWYSFADKADPPLPEYPAIPEPAMVDITPDELTLRITLALKSAMYNEPVKVS